MLLIDLHNNLLKDVLSSLHRWGKRGPEKLGYAHGEVAGKTRAGT